VDASDTRYKNVTEASRFFLHTWIFSTGGGSTSKPDYNVWFKVNDADKASPRS